MYLNCFIIDIINKNVYVVRQCDKLNVYYNNFLFFIIFIFNTYYFILLSLFFVVLLFYYKVIILQKKIMVMLRANVISSLFKSSNRQKIKVVYENQKLHV